MKKENLVFGFDDTLVNSRPLVVEYLNQRWGIKAKESDFYEYNAVHKVVQGYLKDDSLTYEQIYDDYQANFAKSLHWHERIEPMPQMCEVVSELCLKYDLHIATKRNNSGIHLVNMVLDKYLPQKIQSVYCAIKHIEGVGYMFMKKRDFILGLNGKTIALIDDSKIEVEEAIGVVQPYIFDPELVHGPIDGVISVRSWREIGNIFL